MPFRQSRLDFDNLMARAKRYANGVGRLPSMRLIRTGSAKPCEQLVGALKAPEARLEEDKLGNVVFELSRFLRQQRPVRARKRSVTPRSEKERIARPVFIVGINRSGTTLMHRLMVRDKRFWALRMYELVQPDPVDR